MKSVTGKKSAGDLHAKGLGYVSKVTASSIGSWIVMAEYTFGKYGVISLKNVENFRRSAEKFTKMAKEFFESAAAKGHVGAAYMLDCLEKEGEFPSYNFVGVEKVKKLAENDDPEGLYKMGLLYLGGVYEAVEQDSKKAVEYLGRAAKHGFDDAKNRLLWMREKIGEGLSGGKSRLSPDFNCGAHNKALRNRIDAILAFSGVPPQLTSPLSAQTPHNCL